VTATRVILVTVAGPGGNVDVGVRSDATPADLAGSLGPVIGVSPAVPVADHRAPPRPGVPQGRRAVLRAGAPLAEAGVADGDLVLFREADASPGGLPPRESSPRRGIERAWPGQPEPPHERETGLHDH
jgi:hypothetical protein